MDIAYLVTPFITWLIAGTTKLVINSLKAGKIATSQIGYGGLPSNHSAIVSSMAALIALREGIQHPAFGVAVTIAFVVMLDAGSLRRHVGLHAKAINKLSGHNEENPDALRERMGHTKIEILTGVLLGITVAWIIHSINNN